MIQVESNLRFGHKWVVELLFLRDGVQVGRLFRRNANEIPDTIAHMERVFGCPCAFDYV